jgi:hypothetical protein
MQLQKHIDGEWYTSEYNYEGYKLVIKMQPGKGSKIHIWNKDNTKVLKTFRMSFAPPEYFLEKAKEYINSKLK